MEVVKIPLRDKTIVLKSEEWSDIELDVDDITKIHYDNLYGEIVTISALYNKVGLLKAETDNEYEEYKLDCNIFEAQKKKEIVSQKISLGEKKPSISDLEDEVSLHPEVIKKRKRLLTLKKNCDYINALYWAIQSKDKKLSVLSKAVTPEEFENSIIEGKINEFYIKKHKNSL